MSFKVNRRFLLIGLSLLIGLLGCSFQKEQVKSGLCQGINIKCITRKINVEMVTSRGLIVIEIDGENAPLTSTKFIQLIKGRFYDGTSFNRVIKHPFPFVVQGGYLSSNSKYQYQTNNEKDLNYSKNKFLNSIYIPLEIKLSGEKHPRYNKIISRVEDLRRIELTNQRGYLGMSRSKSLDSARSQFYITLKNIPE